MPLAKYRQSDPVTPAPLSVGTPGDKRNLLAENRFEDALKKERPEVIEGEEMDEDQ